ncbi:MAG: GNAT family N-acetyltransferase [Lachnospirales bacterium]
MIRKANMNDLEEIILLYEEVTDYLERNINYSNWKKYEYPNADTARSALREDTLYVYDKNGIIGSSVINQYQPPAYNDVKWTFIPADKVGVIHTLLVSPKYAHKGIGEELIKYAENLARKNNLLYMRLDTYEENIPAQKLYCKLGYAYCGKIDLKPNRLTKMYFCYEKNLEGTK